MSDKFIQQPASQPAAALFKAKTFQLFRRNDIRKGSDMMAAVTKKRKRTKQDIACYQKL